MLDVKWETVKNQYEAWDSAYYDNNQRGKECMNFALAGEQWDGGVVSNREVNNKENLTFNHCLKHLQRAKAQSREIEFSLNLSPTNQIAADNIDETNTFRLILNSILLNDDMKSKFSAAYDIACEHGYSFLEVNFQRENNETLNHIPVVRLHRDSSIAFWDKNAAHPTKVDGRFCGFRKNMSKAELIAAYPQFKDNVTWLKDKDNTVVDYWYRDYKKANFIRLKTGVFKREDLLSVADKNIIATAEDVQDEDDKELIKTADVSCIYFTRFCNEQRIVKPVLFPTEDLPVVKHPAFTTWIPEKGEMTFPLIYPLKGAQKYHNYINSQTATMAKNTSGDKWFMGTEHVATPAQEQEARNINKTEGAIKLGGDISKIRREQSAEIPVSLINLSQSSKTEIDELAGAMLDSQTTDQTVLSGVALDKITHNMGIVNEGSLALHVVFVNQIGKLIRQMISYLYTEERTVIVKQKDGTGQAIRINEDLGTGTIRNNVHDINNNFQYEIIAGPSSAMMKENTIRYLTAYYGVNPAAAQLTGDIYMRSIDSPDSQELARRMEVGIDANLIQYSQGAMSKEEYLKAAQTAQQNQMMQQMQMVMQNPQFQSMMKMAAAEEAKAQAQQFDAQTKRMAAISKAQNDYLDIISKNNRELNQQDIDAARNQLEFIQKLIDEQKNAESSPSVY